MLREAAEYLLQFAETPWGPLVLVAHAFLESFILPVAHDFFLIAVSLGKPKMSLLYALMSTAASTAGNMVGYKIGEWGGKPLLEKRVKSKTLHLTRKLLHRYDAWATAIACFTPFPDKIFSLCAGSFHIPFKKFVVVVFFSRAARFYLISFLLFFYGESIRAFLLEYINAMMLALLAFMILSGIVWHLFVKWLSKRLENEGEVS